MKDENHNNRSIDRDSDKNDDPLSDTIVTYLFEIWHNNNTNLLFNSDSKIRSAFPQLFWNYFDNGNSYFVSEILSVTYEIDINNDDYSTIKFEMKTININGYTQQELNANYMLQTFQNRLKCNDNIERSRTETAQIKSGDNNKNKQDITTIMEELKHNVTDILIQYIQTANKYVEEEENIKIMPKSFGKTNTNARRHFTWM